MLRALKRFLGTDVPVLGVNFGRVGFLTAVAPDALERDLERVFAGDFRVVELPTLELSLDGQTHRALNDAVLTSGTIGRIIELGYAIGDEDLGVQRCDGLICATPQGSTAYNLSNGGPVLVWGLEAMVLTFVAPHTLHVRPLVVPRGADVTVRNLIGRRVDRGDRRRPRRRPARPGRRGRCSARRTAELARDAARSHVLQPLRRHLRPGLMRRALVPEVVPAKLPCSARTQPMLRHLRISNLVLIHDAELELVPGLNAITGETGAGKTIFTNAIGLLLGARGDAGLIGAAAAEAYVEAEFGDVDDESLGPLAELRPDGEEGVVLARRIFADGRTRAYAWGRSAAREDVAAVAERLLAMSGQFEQRRLARPAYQRGVLDSFAGIELGLRSTRGASCRPPVVPTRS